mmetsp:Transcript_9236/g.21366  ORF Transcript_9236/g.21366 Transcript_9236/m.21366 type:complete len:296 (+) Transcript_9236:29-916(+)
MAGEAGGGGESARASSSAFLSSMEAELGGVPANFANFEPSPVFVGDDVTELVSKFGKKIRTGDGLHQERGSVFATRAGVLSFQQPNIYWVEHRDHRYTPRLEDNVIGVVTHAFGESFRLDLAGTGSATLPVLAFDGATKRNRPVYHPGALVFARVAKVHQDMDPELTCMVASGPRKDWMTGQSLYGELKGGLLFQVSLGLADELLAADCPVLLAVARSIAFELAVGANGFVWVNAAKTEEIVAIKSAIELSATTHPSEISNMVSTVVKTIKKPAGASKQHASSKAKAKAIDEDAN